MNYLLINLLRNLDLKTAKMYVDSGNYFWNSGIFVWKTSLIIEKFKKFMPEHFEVFKPLHELSFEKIALNSGDSLKLKSKIYHSLKSVSIDTGILENAGKRIVIPAEFDWADPGQLESN